MTYTATYSPDDNKLRLYASSRLDPETYARVKEAGFRWAPRQELFVAPAWTPSREDLLLELAGEIDDEDTTLTERAEERADRFDGYHENRLADAESARKAVASIADSIPLGQPILVGHHSERHARKDAERIRSGMQRAVNAWRTAQYWTDRASGAIRHAKYKERPDVRARRIKGLEAELRKVERSKAQAELSLRVWSTIHEPGPPKLGVPDTLTFHERAVLMSGRTNTAPYMVYSDLVDGKITPEEAQERTLKAARGSLAHCDRWSEHLCNRLAYERTMLADAGGTVTDQVKPEKGGACRCWASPFRYEGGWSYIVKVNKVSVTVLDNWGNAVDRDGSRNFTRTVPFDKLHGIMTRAEVEAAKAEGRLVESSDHIGFLLSTAPPDPELTIIDDSGPAPDGAAFEAMAASLKNGGVKIVSAPQLFPTPPALAARLVELAEIYPEHRVLEPSAGTGALLRAIGPTPDKVAVEINSSLVDVLIRGASESGTRIHQADFLACTEEELGSFDRIVMNPPFAPSLADVDHVRHAYSLLRPGGRLVAIMSPGFTFRQDKKAVAFREFLAEIGGSCEPNPDGSFSESGTEVRTVTVVLERPGDPG